MSDLVVMLSAALGPEAVLRGADARERMDARSEAGVLLLPRTTAEVSRALALCHHANCPVVPQGGLTGLVHGTSAGPGDVVLSLDRMRRIEEVDRANRCMTVQAGTPLQAAQEAAQEAGLMLALDLGARGTATIGGAIATNAGGTRVLRFGMMREMVLGLEVVLADGTVLDARSKLLKNNTGYDLKQLFIGAEGTLGVVTGAVLRLRPHPRSHQTALLACEGFDQLTRLLFLAETRLLESLTSFEVMWQSYYELATAPPAPGRPIVAHGHGYYVLIETMGADPEHGLEQLIGLLVEAESSGLAGETVVARGSTERAAMWAIRDDVQQIGRDGPYFGYDVSLPIDTMEGYVERVSSRLARSLPQARAYVFGHLADGNLHVLVRVDDCPHSDVSAIVYDELPPSCSVSAEHGIGLLKKSQLALSRSEHELALMHTLKCALDPQWILNRGKVFDRRSTT